MGGFLAIAFSNVYPVNNVVAMTPQWSIHPDILPAESYLNYFTDRISDWKIKDLSDAFVDETNYFIFNSDNEDDQYQIRLFPKQDNIDVYEFGPAFDHDLPEALPPGVLEKLMMSCLEQGKDNMVRSFISDYYG